MNGHVEFTVNRDSEGVFGGLKFGLVILSHFTAQCNTLFTLLQCIADYAILEMRQVTSTAVCQKGVF